MQTQPLEPHSGRVISGGVVHPVIADARELQPFYFTVVFWGKTHREYFLDLLLASLLSPNNLPALDPRRRSKFLIAAPTEDWLAIRDEPRVKRLAELMEVVHLDLPAASADGEGKMMTMSRGHKIVSERCFKDRAYGVYFTADIIMAEGAVAALQRLGNAGHNVVLVAAIRFSQDPILAQMKQEGFLSPGAPIVISPRDLVRISVKNLHSEILRFEFDAKWFSSFPISVYSWVPPGNGIVLHTFSWAPLLINYAAIERHDSSTFDEWTLDGDYVHRNFGVADGIHVVRDSDELMMISVTRESDLHFDVEGEAELLKRLPVIGTRYKRSLVQAVFNNAIMDPLKRQIFSVPTFFHWSDLDATWRRQAEHLSRRILSGPTNLPGIGGMGSIARAMAYCREPRRQILWYYHRRRFLLSRIKEKLSLGPRGPDCNDPSWFVPAIGIANPVYTARVVLDRLRKRFLRR